MYVSSGNLLGQASITQTLKADSSCSSLSDLGKTLASGKAKKAVAKEESKTTTHAQSKAGTSNSRQIKLRTNSTIQPKGEYESENETKSMNSTTTSSTMPFVPTRNLDNNNPTNKNSSRSLS